MTQIDSREVALMTEIVTGIVKGVVSHPEAVQVTPSEHGSIIAWQIRPDMADVPRVIGKGGKHFRALEALMTAIAKLIDREAHVVVDDKGKVGTGSVPRTFALGQRKDFASVIELLKLVLLPFLDEPDKLRIKTTEMNKTTILEVQIAAADWPSIYGVEVMFDYGADGHILGAIKNIFDGIGKNHGRIIRIGVVKV